GEGLRSGGAASGQRHDTGGVLQLPRSLRQARCCRRRRASNGAQCQRFRRGDHTGHSDRLLLCGRPPRRSLADRGWARAFPDRAAFGHELCKTAWRIIVPRVLQLDDRQIVTSARPLEGRALIVCRHHVLVRISHWLNTPLLIGLILSGISIYWASPIYEHAPD